MKNFFKKVVSKILVMFLCLQNENPYLTAILKQLFLLLLLLLFFFAGLQLSYICTGMVKVLNEIPT